MDLKTFHDFLDYHDKVRNRTKTIIAKIPPDKINWPTARENSPSLI